MNGIAILVKVDEMYNILHSASHCWSRDEDGIGWSKVIGWSKSALEYPYVYYASPLLRGRVHLVRDTVTEKEFDIAL